MHNNDSLGLPSLSRRLATLLALTTLMRTSELAAILSVSPHKAVVAGRRFVLRVTLKSPLGAKQEEEDVAAEDPRATTANTVGQSISCTGPDRCSQKRFIRKKV
ncbi:hypothetical protein OUZ56_017498 [Daphnia magna]|uniref:Secreted protein n=1 Tax=Daphnia magna TaxID=35525 RepID=A0ABR0ASX6_9CRUS|nr:hypothetical protein OUZ56_017498 [Daphnia magna]